MERGAIDGWHGCGKGLGLGLGHGTRDGGGAHAVGEEGISIIDFGVGEPLAVCGTDGAARRDGGATRPQQAEAVPGKDAGAEMKVVGDALTACATGDRLSG